MVVRVVRARVPADVYVVWLPVQVQGCWWFQEGEQVMYGKSPAGKKPAMKKPAAKKMMDAAAKMKKRGK